MFKLFLSMMLALSLSLLALSPAAAVYCPALLTGGDSRAQEIQQRQFQACMEQLIQREQQDRQTQQMEQQLRDLADQQQAILDELRQRRMSR